MEPVQVSINKGMGKEIVLSHKEVIACKQMDATGDLIKQVKTITERQMLYPFSRL